MNNNMNGRVSIYVHGYDYMVYIFEGCLAAVRMYYV